MVRRARRPGTFQQISVGGWHSCAVRTAGEIACWGLDEYGETSPPTDPTLEDVATGNRFSCGETTTHEIRCWGRDHYGQASPP